ncbi:4-alpha-glucanotransferase [Beggiatoa leptomitoformis]|uniref:4-alpha-glucanotransferase n=1 Tax=Beggiatoa leptomitoformis TaxID=288004 RepID=A0A2N9YIT8_9GAMM|nr:4-alpha-glucanotransferase [Beggiatoa leptomitoformis]ALG67512.1 4-alpha-glucanotransferase [Beggiatoa leptomitoformis]AUI70265.1 4-alpha-glucanotransferase [Beggiatoa leptomitoformis]
MKISPLTQRRAGVLLHPTALPTGVGNGDIGADAYRFIDFLADCHITLWQMLPIGITHDDLSPYQCQSVHAGNHLLINLQDLQEQGWLTTLPPVEDFPHARAYREHCLALAYEGFKQQATPLEQNAFSEFCAMHYEWLADFALFRALRLAHQNHAWWDWSPALRDRDPQALALARQQHAIAIKRCCFEQFIFFQQWHRLKNYANHKGVYLLGDIPIFVAEDSADVWAQRQNFLLDETGRPHLVAGVPPDYFSATGQRWGNPLYDWDFMQQDGFRWWSARLKTLHDLFDVARIDHFRGFAACWAIPATETTAVNGEWLTVPGDTFFRTILPTCSLPLIAEDLGVITEDVIALRETYQFPGMKILQFAFDSDAYNPYLPHNYEVNSVVYTGTHDNDTTLGWFNKLLPAQRDFLSRYLHKQPDMPWDLITIAFASVAKTAIIPLQDMLSLDTEHRMNTPSVTQGNWRWRFEWQWLSPDIIEKLAHLVSFYAREGRDSTT